jgi:hypothetical protein
MVAIISKHREGTIVPKAQILFNFTLLGLICIVVGLKLHSKS